ncbi:MAG: response regulator transcription factor [Chloroflexi bacterium]|nr:response regulator transcription factor [Chloroflexota bacterium]
MRDHRASRGQLDRGTTSEQTFDNAARTAELFRSIIEAAEKSGDAALVARLSALSSEAEERLERLRTLRHADASTLAPRRHIRVLLVDDHELSREALRSVLRAEHGFTVVGEAGDGDTAIQQARHLGPDLVLMDVRLPGTDGLAATRTVLAELPQTTVVMLSSYQDRTFVLEALRAGASGYALKGASKQELLAIVHAALAGERRIQASLGTSLLQEEAAESDSRSASPSQLLSDRELEVLRLMAQGQTNAAIGHRLHLSVNTVKTHVQHLLRKLDAPDRAAAVARAAALGLLAVPPSAAALTEAGSDRIS